MRRRPVVLVGVAGALAAGAAQGCYGATEISVTLTTNADCASMVTQLYTGAAGTVDVGTAPAAEKSSCEVVSEGRIGTLTIVPSGARDDRFDVEAVAAVGVPASDCTSLRTATTSAPVGMPKTAGCIVARRRVSFRPHHALSLPIKLSASCIGVPCGADQTCDLGVCSSTADCTEDGCPQERAAATSPGADAAVDAGDAGSDALADGPIDAPVDAPVPRCGPTAEVVVSGQAIVGRLVMQGADLVYVNGGPLSGTGAPSEIRRVPRRAKAGATVLRAASAVHQAGASYQMVAANGPALAWTEQQTLTTFQYAPTGAAAMSFPSPPGTYSKASMTSLDGALYVGFWMSGGTPAAFVMDGAMSLATSASATKLPGPVPDIVVDPVTREYFGVSNLTTVVHFGLSSTMNAAKQIGWLTMTSLLPDLALGNQKLFVASVAAPKGILRLDSAGITDTTTVPLSAWLANVVPETMTSDDAFLYYVAAASLFRADVTRAPVTPIPLGSTGAKATRLVVDDQCLYWVESETTIMTRAKQ